MMIVKELPCFAVTMGEVDSAKVVPAAGNDLPSPLLGSRMERLIRLAPRVVHVVK